MASGPRGEIGRFLSAVGLTARDGDVIPDLISHIAAPFETDSVREAGVTWTYWMFHSVGTELVWVKKRLAGATLYVQGSATAGYRPYPRPLFADFKNEADQATVVDALGTPSATGDWNGPWIRYDQPQRQLRFEFDEADTIWTVSVSQPVD